jgi:hypothetical protein
MDREMPTIGARTAVLLAIATAVVLGSFGGSASAAEVHVYSHTFGTGLSLTSQSGIAVNGETGEAYIADTGHSRIAKFTSAGSADGTLATATAPTFIAVDNSSGPSKGDIYIVEGKFTVTKLDPAGALVTGWGTGGHLTSTLEILGIAENPSGDLWVLSEDPGHVIPSGNEGIAIHGLELDQSGALIRSWTVPFEHGFPTLSRLMPVGAAVDSFDNYFLYVGQRVSNVTFGLRRLNVNGAETALGAQGRAGVAVEPTTSDIYEGILGEGSPNLLRFSPQLKQIEQFGGEYEGTVRTAGSSVDELKGLGSLAVGATGAIYAVDPSRGKVAVYELEEVDPPSGTIEPADSITQTSAHIVGHINPNAPTGSRSSHDVAWRFVCAPACPGHEGHIEVKLDGSERTVEATIGGLRPGTEYSIRLFAENRGGSGEAGPELFTTSPAAPTVTDSAASEVFGGGATFNAEINPNGAETTYHFEYMTKAAFEAEGGFHGAGVRLTPESGSLPAKTEAHQILVRVNELEPNVGYVYQAVATNSVGVTTGGTVAFRAQVGPNPVEGNCLNQALRTGPGARLADCRAYELVTPAEKNGASVESFTTNLLAAPDGSAVTWYTGQTATGIPSSSGAHQDFAFHLSTLVGEEWTSQRLLAPEGLGELSDLVGLTADARYALLETAARGGFDPALYLLDTSGRTLTTVVPPQVGQQVETRAFSFDGASADDKLLFFESRLKLTANAASEKDNLYVWNRAAGALSLAGALPGSKAEAPPGGSFGGAYSWSGGNPLGPEVGGSEQGLYVGAVHAISESGDSAYFTAGGTGQLYLRRGLTGTKPSTLRVSIATAGVTDPNGEQPAAFQEATPDGRKVFFLSNGKLTENANTGSSDEGTDLYRYDAEAKALVDMTPLAGGAGARVQGLLGVSEDGRSGYFVAKGVLATGGVEEESNLYRFAEASGGGVTYKFVATLSPPSNAETFQLNWSGRSAEPKTARVSADGNTVIFMSARPLTGNKAGSCIYGSCMQLYRYSMTGESLVCVSCNPTEAGAPLFGAELYPAFSPTVIPGNPPNSTAGLPSASLPRNLSTSGTRVFFQSAEPLLPEDVNGADPGKNCTNQRTCVDVYEWEAVGTGSCQTPNQAGGCLYLLSSGESGRSSFFLNASADGSSTFVLTSSALVPLDEDELGDVYDARVNGGLAAQHAVARGPCNSPEGCKGGGSSSAPAPASEGTSSFQGPGNIKPKTCKKGLVLKHGKCVKPAKNHKKSKNHKKKSRPSSKTREGGAK